ncbi:hypothetical protein DA075_01025 [Methylobacterium currus]|uniref:Uncharacterized protein n=1 Tax=Methylobacterium currus TaxID=2051553 RepID=A0A2R4WDW9_9HYPH|nr:hypothetical protein [Methylobacterium currus]AWB19689.1 hypothetical protein DA075_01025 [Methylobacterium currus]
MWHLQVPVVLRRRLLRLGEGIDAALASRGEAAAALLRGRPLARLGPSQGRRRIDRQGAPCPVRLETVFEA